MDWSKHLEDTRSTSVVREAYRQMRAEQGRPQSPGFELLCEVTRGGFDWPHELIVEVADMLRPRCLAHALSYRRGRAARLWELVRLSENDLLIVDRISRHRIADDHPRRAFAEHPAAGVRLWTEMQNTARSQELREVLVWQLNRQTKHDNGIGE